MSYIACVIDLNAYVTDLNIKRYRKLLETSVDVTEQQTIHTLLAEEKAKAGTQSSSHPRHRSAARRTKKVNREMARWRYLPLS